MSLIAKKISSLSEVHDEVVVIVQHLDIVSEYLHNTPGRKSVVINPRLYYPYQKSTNKVRFATFQAMPHIAKTANVMFVLPGTKLPILQTPVGGSACVVLTPVLTPRIEITKKCDPDGYAQVCTFNIASFAYQERDSDQLVTRTPVMAFGQENALAMNHYPLEDMVRLFHVEQLTLNYDMGFVDWLDFESINRIEHQFNIAVGMALNEAYLHSKTWLNQNKIKMILEVLCFLGMAKRFLNRKTLEAGYTIPNPVNHDIVKAYVTQARDDINLYKDIANKSQSAFEKSVIMKTQEYCVLNRIDASLFLGGTEEKISLSSTPISQLLP